MSPISRTAPLLAGLRYLRVKAQQPGCWLVTLPKIRTHSQADAERDALLSQLRGAYRTRVWGISPDVGNEIIWRVSADNDLSIPAEVHESHGDWALLLFARPTPEFHPPPLLKLGLKCQDLQASLILTGADAMIVSLPDDIEWLVAERT